MTEPSKRGDLSSRNERASSLRSFRHRNFRLFFGFNLVSNIGTWVQRVAQDWLVLQLTHSGTDLGLVTALQFLPVLLLSLHGGALADRVDKRIILIITNIGGGVSALLLGILVMSNHVQIWHVYVLAASLGLFGAIDSPVRQSFAVEMVGPEDLSNAVSLNSANFNGARLVGPALSGLMISAFGTGPSFILNGVSFLGVIFALTSIRSEELYRKVGDSEVDRSVRVGLRYVRARPELLAAIVIVGTMSLCGLNFQISMALMAKYQFGRGAGAYGLLGSALAIGSLIAAVLSARLGRKPQLKYVISGATAFGFFTFFSALMPNYQSFAMVLPFCGFFAIMTIVAASSFIQASASRELHGRVVGIYMLVYVGGTPIGSPFIGWIGQVAGPRWSLFIGGGVTAIVAMLFGAWNFRRLARSTGTGRTSHNEFDGQHDGLSDGG
jgi:MFS family permease